MKRLVPAIVCMLLLPAAAQAGDPRERALDRLNKAFKVAARVAPAESWVTSSFDEAALARAIARRRPGLAPVRAVRRPRAVCKRGIYIIEKKTSRNQIRLATLTRKELVLLHVSPRRVKTGYWQRPRC